MAVIDVDRAGVRREGLARSRVPWSWTSGPRGAARAAQLTPVLEQAAPAREGKVDLAKVDTDANPQIASFGIQGIPAVKAFRDGGVVDEFAGAKPPAAGRAVLRPPRPSEADQLVAAGRRGVPAPRARTRAQQRRRRRRPGDRAAPPRRDGGGRAGAGQRDGAFAADGLRARIALERDDTLDLADAFAALDAGERERAVDLLIEACRPPMATRTTCAASWWRSSTTSASSTPRA